MEDSAMEDAVELPSGVESDADPASDSPIECTKEERTATRQPIMKDFFEKKDPDVNAADQKAAHEAKKAELQGGRILPTARPASTPRTRLTHTRAVERAQERDRAKQRKLIDARYV